MLNLSGNFIKIFITLIIVEILTLIIICILYCSNTNNILSDLREIRINYIFNLSYNYQEYINKKFRLYLDDLVLILKTLELFDLENTFKLDNFLSIQNKFPNCIEEEKTTKYNYWYLESDYLSILKTGCWYYNEETSLKDLNDYEEINYFVKLFKMNDFLKEIFEKYYSYKNKIYVNIDYIHITCHNGIFYKYPQSYTQFESDFNTTEQSFYEEEKNIILSKPYILQNNKYSTDLCIKSSIIMDNEKPKYVVCASYNFYDLNMFYDTYLTHYGAKNYDIYIIYSNGLDIIDVIYSNKYNINNLKCKINSDDEFNYICNPISFFDVLYREELDKFYNKLKNSGLNENEIKKLYINNYLNIKENSFYSNLKNSLLKIINSQNDKNYFIQENELFINENKLEIGKNNYEEIYYLYPLKVDYNYNSNYKINFNNIYSKNFYILIREKNLKQNDLKTKFNKKICLQIFFFFLILLGVNILIGCLYFLLYLLFHKSYAKSLDKITSLYFHILNKTYENENLNNNLDFNNKKSCCDCLIEFPQIRFNNDINQSLLTLKSIIIILNYIENNNKKEEIEKEKFFSSLYFLCEYIFSSKNLINKKLDFYFINLLLENVFILLIQKYKKQKQILLNNNNNNNNNNKENLNKNIQKIIQYLNEIDEYYLKCNQFILHCKNNLKNELKNISNFEMKDKIDLDNFYLTSLKEKIIYLYLSHRFILLEDSILKQYENEEFIGEYLNEEEKNIINQLKNNNNIDIKNFLFINNKEDEIINDNKKLFIKKLLKYCIEYLELHKENKYKLKIFLMKKEKNNFNFENNINNIKIYKLTEKLKIIIIQLFLSKFYLLLDNENKSLNFLEWLMNNLNSFQLKLDKIIEKNNIYNINNWQKTNFILLILNSFLYQNILLILSNLNSKFKQIKSELFINLNILDFSPIYSIKIRKIILNKLIKLILKLRTDLILKNNNIFNLNKFKNLISNSNYIEIQRIIYKLISIRNITNKNIKKNILFVFDLSNQFIKDSNFQKIFIDYINDNLNSNNFLFNFSAFDIKLYMLEEIEYSIIQKEKYDKNYITTIKKFEKNIINELIKDKQTTQINNNNYQNINNFFNFINNYQEIKFEKEKFRADKALYHSLLFSFNNNNNNINFPDLNKSFHNNDLNNEIFNKHKDCNYLILITNLNSKFTENKSNLIEMSKLAYDKKISLIIILNYDENLENEINIKEKVNIYKNYVKTRLIDGHLFIMKNYSLLNYILNSIFPTKFNESNFDIIKEYLINNEKIQQFNEIKK